MDESVLISLPLAGYLTAIVCISPFARPLVQWLGRRMLLVAAAIPVFLQRIFFCTSPPPFQRSSLRAPSSARDMRW
ncbi:hypothetical protein ACFS07_27730 [Undibacterium arcticum]